MSRNGIPLRHQPQAAWAAALVPQQLGVVVQRERFDARGTRFADVLHPGLVDEAEATCPLGALPHAVDIAEAVAFLASDRARFITGETLNVAGGSFMRY